MSDKLDERVLAHSYHKVSPSVQEKITQMRQMFIGTAIFIDEIVPECRAKSLAFTALEEAAMWVIKALALTDPEGKVISP